MKHAEVRHFERTDNWAIGPKAITLNALSGGGHGSKVHPAGQPGQLGVAYWHTQRQKTGLLRGGLPPGFYKVHKPAQHPHLGLSAYPEPTLTALLHLNLFRSSGVSVTQRGGFYIHGIGPKGSDGCIVVPPTSFHWLMDLLAQHTPLMLQVVNPGMSGDKLPNPNTA